MAFPTSPTDGQQATVNNIVYTFSSASNAWTRTPGGQINVTASGYISAIGNIYGGNIVGTIVGSVTNAQTVTTNAQPNITSVGTLTSITSSGLISTTGNISGNYILGNGALLTGVSTTSSNINSGNSNVTISAANANVTVSVSTVGNVAIFSPTGISVLGTITGNGNITGGNILTAGLISATGNVSGNYFVGNGSALTGISSGNSSINITVTTISANYTIASGQNGLSVGPVTTGNNVQVSVASGQRWIIL